MALALDDTIAAISTPAGMGGIGIVRLSGPEALSIARSLFRSKGGDLADTPRCLLYGWIVHPETREAVDEVLVAYMPAPNTYTRQDVVEINAHGGTFVLKQVLNLCLQQGARVAEPGEMTLRAFANGRIDLTQAEAVRDVIEARTALALEQATRQLRGALAGEIAALRQRLLSLRALIEMSMDFEEEEEWKNPDIEPELRAIEAGLDRLLQEARTGMIRREGLRVAIVGRPNVGKSSLMNALLREERAIVTAVPGTTRDTLEEVADIQGLAVVFVDTAGLNDNTDDLVERIGIERARRVLREAHVVLLVLDSSQPLTEDDLRIAEELRQGRSDIVVVWNKSDLPSAPGNVTPLAGVPQVCLSAKTGAGVGDLEQTLLSLALSGSTAEDNISLTNERHEDAVRRALKAVRRILESSFTLPPDLIALDLSIAIETLGEITGEAAPDELLSLIFSTFCVGK